MAYEVPELVGSIKATSGGVVFGSTEYHDGSVAAVLAVCVDSFVSDGESAYHDAVHFHMAYEVSDRSLRQVPVGAKVLGCLTDVVARGVLSEGVRGKVRCRQADIAFKSISDVEDNL